MKIEKIYPQSFRAKSISNMKLAKMNTSVVKIDVQNDTDIKALENITKYWLNGKYTTNIYHAACEMKNNKEFFKYNEIYALTTQISDYENLNSRKILGLLHINQINDKTAFIEHIEADPEIIYSFNRKIKGIGSSLLKFLKTKNDKILCSPTQTQSVKTFYLKNNFKESSVISNLFVWFK